MQSPNEQLIRFSSKSTDAFSADGLTKKADIFFGTYSTTTVLENLKRISQLLNNSVQNSIGTVWFFEPPCSSCDDKKQKTISLRLECERCAGGQRRWKSTPKIVKMVKCENKCYMKLICELVRAGGLDKRYWIVTKKKFMEWLTNINCFLFAKWVAKSLTSENLRRCPGGDDEEVMIHASQGCCRNADVSTEPAADHYLVGEEGKKITHYQFVSIRKLQRANKIPP